MKSGDWWKSGSFPEGACYLRNSSSVIFQMKPTKVHLGCSHLVPPSIVELFAHDMWVCHLAEEWRAWAGSPLLQLLAVQPSAGYFSCPTHGPLPTKWGRSCLHYRIMLRSRLHKWQVLLAHQCARSECSGRDGHLHLWDSGHRLPHFHSSTPFMERVFTAFRINQRELSRASLGLEMKKG